MVDATSDEADGDAMDKGAEGRDRGGGPLWRWEEMHEDDDECV